MIGTPVGHYRIVEKLGEGGMGEVYRARDGKLNRDVALKVLPASFAADSDRLARFKREAQVLASLNHPNIAAIYGFEEGDAVPALVMELVDGETLADRLARGTIPVDEALAIARQIAEALEAAHEQGIIHRDLKPANVKVRHDGAVKVLDFGLAKAFDPAASKDIDAATDPTRSIHATDAGIILGTAAYMAPEQARGKPLDKRADIWAFGCVLYELVTGKRPFEADDLSTILAAVLKTEPEWSALPLAAPPGLRRLLARCLDKDPKERLRDIGEARIAIERLLTGVTDESASSVQRRLSWWRRLAIPAAALLIGSAVTGALVWFAGRPAVTAPRVTRFAITAPGAAALTVSGVGRDVALTPDGSRVVYVGANGTTLFVRPLDQLEAIPLARGAPRDPFVSRDGQWVGFFDGGLTLKKVPISGGPAIVVARLNSFQRGGTWADGTIVFGTQTTGLQRVSEDGGVPVALIEPDRARAELAHAWPHVLPDGQTVLYTVMPVAGGLDAAAIAAFDLRSSQSTVLLRGGSDARYADSGHLVYGTAGSLRAIGFDPTRLTVVGPSTVVVPQVGSTPFGAVAAGMAGDGTLVYVTGDATGAGERILVWVDRQGRETPIAAPPRPYYFPRVSPDGTHLAANAVVDQNSDMWLWDLSRASLTRVTSDPAADSWFAWLRDNRIVFSSNRAGAFNLFSQAADGTGAVERLTESSNAQSPSAITPDGTRLLFSETSPTTGDDVMALTLDDKHQVLPIVQTSFDERNGVISPDGRWLAYEANDSGAFEIYIRPVPDVSRRRWQASTSGGTQPLWAPSGQELFYFAPDGALMRVDVTATAQAWKAGVPTKVLEARYVVSTGGNMPRNYDLDIAGQRFLMLKAREGSATGVLPQVVVVERFDEELRRLVPKN